MKKQYEKPTLKINWLNSEDVVTQSSQESTIPGDGWVKDPFGKK